MPCYGARCFAKKFLDILPIALFTVHCFNFGFNIDLPAG
ncbi:hypothetical protein MNBD_ALPHA11-1379 [hydrothermal vent metagenome]|uniref:Uncharacterized protein n=1 Tax=hydrothermal vent metagenome TaxID=652676 RepID=A0A3B0U2U8_9ZZZZ